MLIIRQTPSMLTKEKQHSLSYNPKVFKLLITSYILFIANFPKTAAMASSSFMKIRQVAKVGITHPFGDAHAVKQAFPAGISRKEADPFLMCDYFDKDIDGGKKKGSQKIGDDDYPVDWHPHRGFDIATYLKQGVGRHADSLGNRETFATPGMQWMSTGSGVMHAEGGGDPEGHHETQGFQIWINVPAENKMDDPRYGTVPPEDIPPVKVEGSIKSTVRILAGNVLGKTGPFLTTQKVQMLDFEIQPEGKFEFDIEEGLDTAMLFVYEGEMSEVNQEARTVPKGNTILFDASNGQQRRFECKASSSEGAKAMLFAGKKLKEPIAWHGPIVMNTQEQITATFRELRAGQFSPTRVDWDYKHLSAFPHA
jgi:redox-sensitive bicupin YhaK (pirin superfamily)